MQVAVVYRVANDLHCNIGALAEFDDSGPGPPVGTFRHFGVLPGLATAHASIVFDEQTDLYFMVANAARDSLLPWNAEMTGPQCDASPFLSGTCSCVLLALAVSEGGVC